MLWSSWQVVRSHLEQLPGKTPESDAGQDLEELAGLWDDLADYAFSPGDVCPDNNRWQAGRIRLLDFDLCGFRPRYLDAAYHWLRFCTCNYLGHIPEHATRRAQDAYRARVDVDEERMHLANTAWTLVNCGPVLDQTVHADQPLGPSSLRQMLIWRLLSSARACAERDELPALGQALEQLGRRLSETWQLSPTLPTYPAYQ